MRHKYKGRKLGSDYGHTQAIKKSLVQSLFLNDRIKTTETRAKEIRGDVDRVITWAKKGDLHSRRLAISALGNDKELAREIFDKVSQGMFQDRSGGYTRILKLGPRKGDGAPMVIIQLVTETCVSKADKKAAEAKGTAKKKKATPTKKAEKKEKVVEEIKDSVEAAEETFAENVQEAAKEQLAEEGAEVAAEEAKEAEKAKEAAEKAEAKQAEEAAAAAEGKREAARGDKE